MRGKLGRRARHLQLRRNSLAHHARVFHSRPQDTCDGCTEDCGQGEPPIQLTAKAKATSVRVHIKPDEFTQLLWGAQSWRRPH